MSESAVLLDLRNISCVRDGAEVRGVSLTFAPANSIIVTGDAGGALLARIATLQERPDEGEVWLDGEPLHTLSESDFLALRSRKVGLVFSASHLLPGLSAVENVAVPLFKLLALETDEAAERTHSMLEFVGLRGDPGADVLALTRADQQRVALARALVHRPALLALYSAETDLDAEETAAFRETVHRACCEFGVLAISTLPAGPTACRADRMIVMSTGVAVEP